MIEFVLLHHTYNIGKYMKDKNPNFPSTRTSEDYARALRSKASDFRKKLVEENNGSTEGDTVILTKNHKGVARARLIKLGTEDGIKIHGITYPCNVDSVEILEDDDELSAVWIRYTEDDHILTISTECSPSTLSEASETLQENTVHLNNNVRYANNVLHNANISAEQIRNWINYAWNQSEMAETVKLYQEVLRSVQDAIIETKGGVGQKEKVVFIFTSYL